jgi:hypothetical protein
LESRRKGHHAREQGLGRFFSNVLAAGQGLAVDLARYAARFVQRLEAAMDDTLLAPKRQQRRPAATDRDRDLNASADVDASLLKAGKPFRRR